MKRCFLPIIFSVLLPLSLYSQGVNIAGTINSYYAVTAYANAQKCLVVNGNSGLSVNDLVLIIQMQGTRIDTTNTSQYGTVSNVNGAGQYELNYIQSISGDTICFKNDIRTTYVITAKVQIVRVPDLCDATITATLTCPAWNGITGGIIALHVSNTLYMNAGIDARATGFRGGVAVNATTVPNYYVTDYVGAANPGMYAEKGEGIAGRGYGLFTSGRGSPANGGGGGGNHNSGGGGGSGVGVSTGGQGGYAYNSNGAYSGNYQTPPGLGGKNFTAPGSNLFLGGGGGAGHGNNYGASSSGRGGGLVFLHLNSVVLNGGQHTVSVEGESAVTAVSDGGAGGGAGGTIVLRMIALSSVGTLQLFAKGGRGSDETDIYNQRSGPGGGGGGGRIVLKTPGAFSNLTTNVLGNQSGNFNNNNSDRYGATDGTDGGVHTNISLFDSLIQNPTVKITANKTVLCGNDSATLTSSITTNILWSPATGLSCTTCATTIVKPPVTTMYHLRAQLASGCVVEDSVLIKVPKITPGADQSICAFADSVSLSINYSGTVRSVVWVPKNGLRCDTCATTKAKPNVSTTYYVMVTDTSGCINYDTVKVTIRGSVGIVSAGPDVMLCASTDSVLLKVTSTGTLRKVFWSPKTALACDTCISTKAKPPVSTTYYVVAVDSNGCDSRDTITVRIAGASTSIKSGPQQFICITGDSATLQVAGKVATILWTPGANVRCSTCSFTYAKPKQTTFYTYMAVDSLGCTSTDSIKVTVLPKSIIDAFPDTVLCTSTAALLTVTGSYQNLTWSPSIGLSCTNCPTVLAVPPGKSITYYVTGHNGNSVDCDTRDSIRLKYAPGLENQIPDKVQLCPGDSSRFSIRFGGKINWSPAGDLSCDTCHSVLARPSKTTRFIVTGDSLGCVSRDTVTITVQTTTLKVPDDTVTCPGKSVFLACSSNATTFLWTPANGLSCTNCLTPTASPRTPTMYHINAGSAGCLIRDSVFVDVMPQPVLTVSPIDTTLCKGASVQFLVSVVPTSSTVTWDANSDLSCYNCPNPIAKPQTVGTTTYRAVVHSVQGCDSIINVSITLTEPPVFSVVQKNYTLCEGQSAQLKLSGDTNAVFVWTPATDLSCDTCVSPLFTPKSNGQTIYKVRGSRSAGCFTMDSLTIDVNPIPVITISKDTSVCKGHSARIHVGGAPTILWSPGDGLSCTDCADQSVTPSTTTRYDVRLTNAAGCFRDSSVTVTVIPCGIKPVATSTAIVPFLACDTSVTMLTITNEGEADAILDSIVAGTAIGVVIDPADLSKANKGLPATLRPHIETLKIPLHLIPLMSGQHSADVLLHFGDSVKVMQLSFNTYRDAVEFSLPAAFEIKVDSLIAIPVRATSSQWSEMKLRDSLIITLDYDAHSLYYENRVDVGSALRSDWNVGYDSLASSSSSAVFVARGISALDRDGEIIIPYFRTLLPDKVLSSCKVSVRMPSLRIDCVDETVKPAQFLVTACALQIRRIDAAAAVFGIHSIRPNPAIESAITIDYGLSISCDVDLRLFDASGREVIFIARGKQSGGTYSLTIPLEGIPAGTYFCKLTAGGQVFNESVSVVR